ncbi:hypothetical protein E9228_000905 [Curtobacterium flaccumfaciens]|uniref:Uncharacterized protein n=1 Tax=Curtobacterium salicis TaxID=1779862 RepID=A0ABX0T7Z1_9MICO|nr:hypothetical protein [Curtobacterium sp. WW7]NII40269.1 hypothetical protein [Curtobacterium sp. WW7]
MKAIQFVIIYQKAQRCALSGGGIILRISSKLAAAVVFSTVAAGVAVAAPATANTAVDSTTVTMPMTVVGYDAKVAEAHGYKIETDADGVQRSVPITEAAKKQAMKDAAATQVSKPGGVSVKNIVRGNCGSSSLNIVRYSNGVRIATSYSVKATSIQHTWNVDGSTLTKTFSNGFSGLNNKPTWSATHDVAISGNASAHATVRAGSSALLVNGEVCAAGAPTDAY